MSKSRSEAKEPRILIVGAGIGGISAAIALKRKLGFDNFTIYEKGDGVGGVWHHNTYPGCRSDIPAHWYSLSSDLNPDWSTYYGSQPEIRAYWQSVWERHRLQANTIFNTDVVLAQWDEGSQVYHVTLEDVRTGAQRVEDANIFWQATGGLLAPFFPEDIPAMKEFHGAVWHSARWRHDVDLNGKRVGVIGNGCSGAQIVPNISENPSVQVINFIRSPQWYVHRRQFEYRPSTKWIFRHIPIVMRAYRALIFYLFDLAYMTAFRGENTTIQKKAREQLTAYIKIRAPLKYADFLIPTYPPGCKRVVIGPQYLESLHRHNVDLNWNAIEGVVKDGLKLNTGEVIPLDVIIFATGFSLLPPRLNVIGRNGQSMQEFFDEVGGPAAYKGISIPNFPNFYMLLGPNTAGGHASVIFNEEVQIDHALQLIKPVVEGKARSFEIRRDIFTQYNDWIQQRLQRSVWAHCQSYYRSRSSDGRNIAIFPGPVTLFWWITRKVSFSEYGAVGAEKFGRERQTKRLRAIFGTLMVLVLTVFVACRFKYMLTMLALCTVKIY